LNRANRQKAFLLPTIQHLLTSYEALADCFAQLGQWEEVDQVSDRAIDSCSVLIAQMQRGELFDTASNTNKAATLPCDAMKTPQRFAFNETPSHSLKSYPHTPHTPYSTSKKWSSPDVEVAALMKLLLRKRAFGYISKGKLYHLQASRQLPPGGSPSSTAAAIQTPAGRNAFLRMKELGGGGGKYGKQDCNHASYESRYEAIVAFWEFAG